MLSTEELISKIKLVNDKWLLTEPWKENTNWATACYFMGCLDAYEETGEKRYLDAAVRWGEEHDWRACVEGNLDYARDVLVNHFTVEGRLDWKFDDIADYLNIHADHLTCGGTFLKLKKYVPEKANIDSIKRIMDFMINDPHVDYWWWVDTIHMFVKSLSGDYIWCNHPGHCSWNRTNGALLVPNPDMDGTEVLQICRIPDPRLFSEKQGVTWNFPCNSKGSIRVGMRIEGEGVKIALCDRWFNPVDEYAGEQSPFSFKLTPDAMVRGRWYDVRIDFDVDKKMAYVYLNDNKLFGVRMKYEPKHGISYIHIQTDAEGADYNGTLIKGFEMKGGEVDERA